MSAKTLALIEEHDVKWVDLRFTDTRGKEQHVTVPARDVNEEFFENGQMFDGSSIEGWKGINESDMILRPEDGTGFLDRRRYPDPALRHHRACYHAGL